jgi:hypothetical protein
MGVSEFTLQYNLASYNADFIICILGLLVIYFITHIDDFVVNRLEVIILICCAPIIKASGITISFMAMVSLLFYALSTLNHARSRGLQTYTALRACVLTDKKRIYFALIMLAVAYSTCLSINWISSGYPFYPATLLGNGEKYGITVGILSEYKAHAILGWARSPGINYNLGTVGNNWVVEFISSWRGQLSLALWLGPLMIAAIALLRLQIRSQIFEGLFHSLSSVLIGTTATVTLILVAMPPERRFYMWLTPACIYLAYLTIREFPNQKRKIGLMFCLILAPSIAWQLKDMKNSALLYGKTKRSSYITQTKENTGHSYWSNVFWNDHYISSPKLNDQCWTALPPCSYAQITMSKNND